MGVRVFEWKAVLNLGIGGWCWLGVGVGIGRLLGVRVFECKGVGNLGVGKIDQLWTPGQRPADLGCWV